MRHLSSRAVLLLCALLATSCAGMKSGTLPQEEAATSPWKSARVGDRVEYAFESKYFDSNMRLDSAGWLHGRLIKERGGRSILITGRLVLEVVAVRPPWAWLTVTFLDENGRPHLHPPLSRPVVLPMRMEDSHPHGPPPLKQGTVTQESVTVAGRSWEARRTIEAPRIGDGLEETWVEARVPGPLYLTQGLLESSTPGSGMGVSQSYHLVLKDFRQGTPGVMGEVPRLDNPLGPGTWYDEGTRESGLAPTVLRTCMSAESGYLLVSEWKGAPGAAPPCGGFQGANRRLLADALVMLIVDAASVLTWWPPISGRLQNMRRETVSLGAHSVSTFVRETRWGPENDPTASFDEARYAAEPLGPELDGLVPFHRFSPLSSGTYRFQPGGPPTPMLANQLEDWGVWWRDGGY